MSWRDRLLGKKPEPRGQTTTPPPAGRWEDLQKSTSTAGQGLSDLWASLRGKPGSPQLVCQEGHAVRRGSDTCPYGHYVG